MLSKEPMLASVSRYDNQSIRCIAMYSIREHTT